MSQTPKKKPSGNIFLLLLSLIIASLFITVLFTQMEGVKGWEYRDVTPYEIEISATACDDLNGDGIQDLILLLRSHKPNEGDTDAGIPNAHFGAIRALDSKTSKILWNLTLDGPALHIHQVFDLNGDGIRDFFLTYGKSNGSFNKNEAYLLPNQYSNVFLSGNNGSLLSNGILSNLTTHFVTDILVADTNFTDNIPDFIISSTNMSNPLEASNITAYFVNGTVASNFFYDFHQVNSIHFLNYTTDQYIFGLSNSRAFLLNTSIPTELLFMWESIMPYGTEVEIFEDLNGDNISELIVAGENEVARFDPQTGNLLDFWDYPGTGHKLVLALERIEDITADNIKDFLIVVHQDDTNSQVIASFSANSTNITLLNVLNYNFDEFAFKYIPSQFFTDGQAKICISYRVHAGAAGNERIELRPFENFEASIWTTSGNYQARGMVIIPEFETSAVGIIGYSGETVLALSSRGPRGYWMLYQVYPEYLSYFILVLVALLLLVALPILLIYKRKKFLEKRSDLEQIKEHAKKFKLTITLTIVIIVLILMIFFITSYLAGIFNTTLIIGSMNEQTLLGMGLVFMVFFTAFPLVPAIYNKVGPYFTIPFLKYRRFVFKFYTTVDKDIKVIDMPEKYRLSFFQTFKRALFPIFVSIAVGINLYNFLAPEMQNISVASNTFFQFMYYFLYFGIVPMIISYIFMFLFIPGSWLLDDCGLVYYISYRKDHLPGDVERISNWALNPIKAIAGFTAILSYFTLIMTLNLDELGGFEGDLFMQAFSTAFIYIFFYGFPFIAGMGLMFFAIIYMEMNLEVNRANVYERMEKAGFDTTPEKLSFREVPSTLQSKTTSIKPPPLDDP